MTSILRVNPALNSADLNALIGMHMQCFRPAELSMELFARGSWWAAKNGSEFVGFAGMTPSVRWSDTVYFCRSGIVESARGAGLQKRLISTRLAAARKMNFRWAITDTRRNPASANSLISQGFQMYQPSIPWSFRDACYWKKELSK